MAGTLPFGATSMAQTGSTAPKEPGYLPGINVGAAVKQLTGQGDQDIFSAYVFKGAGEDIRQPTSGIVGSQTPGNYTYYGQTTVPGAQHGASGSWNPASQGGTDFQIAQQQPTYTDNLGRTWGSVGEYQANVDNWKRNAGVKQGGYVSGAESTLGGASNTYNNDSQDFVSGIRQGQNTINSNRVNNALNLRRSMAAIASGLRQGIRSGAVNLANMNAMDSGAADAMARAFARQGNSQAGDVNNQSQIAENQFATEQNNLSLQKAQGLGRLKSWRQNEVDKVSRELWQNLSELDAEMQSQGVGGAVDMGARDRVIGNANAKLDQIDQLTQAELAKITGLEYGQVQEQASKMDAEGALVRNPFAVESGTIQWGQTGGGVGNMAGAPIGPISNGPKYKDDEQVYLPFSALKDEAIA